MTALQKEVDKWRMWKKGIEKKFSELIRENMEDQKYWKEKGRKEKRSYIKKQKRGRESYMI